MRVIEELNILIEPLKSKSDEIKGKKDNKEEETNFELKIKN